MTVVLVNLGISESKAKQKFMGRERLFGHFEKTISLYYRLPRVVCREEDREKKRTSMLNTS